MKKKLAVTLIMVGILCICGCGTADDDKKDVGASTTPAVASATPTEAPTATPDSEAEKFKDVEIKIIGKKNYKKDVKKGRLSPFVALITSVKNKSGKDISSIYGTLAITKTSTGDPVGKVNFNLSTKMIKKGKTTNFKDYGVNINQHDSAAVDLYNAKYEDLSFEYKFTMVTFTDGSKIKAED